MPLTFNYQWMMIAALPFMLLYDGRRGRPVKWLFYWFYPLHLAVITVGAHLLGVHLGVRPGGRRVRRRRTGVWPLYRCARDKPMRRVS